MSKNKDHNALVGRVKKAVKKTRRKLSEEQFEKELQRTISFLADLKDHIGVLQAKAAERETKSTAAKAEAKAAKPAAAKVETKAKPVVAKAEAKSAKPAQPKSAKAAPAPKAAPVPKAAPAPKAASVAKPAEKAKK